MEYELSTSLHYNLEFPDLSLKTTNAKNEK